MTLGVIDSPSRLPVNASITSSSSFTYCAEWHQWEYLTLLRVMIPGSLSPMTDPFTNESSASSKLRQVSMGLGVGSGDISSWSSGRLHAAIDWTWRARIL